MFGKAVDAILGNAGQIKPEQIREEAKKCLLTGEKIVGAYQTIRDQIIFTDKRLIHLDVQGITGSRKSILSVPYRSVTSFSMQSAGTIDTNVEFFIACKQMEYPITLTFKKDVDLQPLYDLVSQMVLGV